MRINGRQITLAFIATVTVVIVGLLLMSQSTSAYLWPKNVRGYVWDNAGRPVPDTPITINILWESNNSVRATYTATTDSIGFYSKSVIASDWDPGDKIQVIATHAGDQRTNTTDATVDALQYVNVTFPYEIPEFGQSWAGIVVAGGAIAAVGVALLIFWKRK